MDDTAGTRHSRQRQAVLDAVRTCDHPTADDVCETVRKSLPRVSLGTVYRNLELLASCGMIRRLPQAGQPTRFDADCGVHYHIRCRECGRVDDLPAGPVWDQIQSLSSKGYRDIEHHLELIGLCPHCAGNHGETDRQ